MSDDYFGHYSKLELVLGTAFWGAVLIGGGWWLFGPDPAKDFKAANEEGTVAAFEEYLEDHADSKYAEEARQRIQDLKSAEQRRKESEAKRVAAENKKVADAAWNELRARFLEVSPDEGAKLERGATLPGPACVFSKPEKALSKYQKYLPESLRAQSADDARVAIYFAESNGRKWGTYTGGVTTYTGVLNVRLIDTRSGTCIGKWRASKLPPIKAEIRVQQYQHQVRGDTGPALADFLASLKSR